MIHYKTCSLSLLKSHFQRFAPGSLSQFCANFADHMKMTEHTVFFSHNIWQFIPTYQEYYLQAKMRRADLTLTPPPPPPSTSLIWLLGDLKMTGSGPWVGGPTYCSPFLGPFDPRFNPLPPFWRIRLGVERRETRAYFVWLAKTYSFL